MTLLRSIKLLSFIIINLLALNPRTFAQDKQSIPVERITSELISNIKQFHIQPKEINDDFGRDVHSLLLNEIDEDKLLFTNQDAKTLDSLSIQIDDDIEKGTTVYLTKFKFLLAKAVEKSNLNLEAYFKNPTSIKAIPGASVMKTAKVYPELNAQKSLWSNRLRDAVLNYSIDDLAENGYVYQKDSLQKIIDRNEEIVHNSFADYFKNLASEDLINEIYLNAIANTFDPHTSYFTMEEMTEFEEELSGEREIFGINYDKNTEGEFVITNVYPGSAAWLSGEVHEGDIIKKIKFGKGNEKALTGLTLMELHNLFNENASHELDLTLQNEQRELVKIHLEKTKVFSDEDIIKTAILQGEKKVGYISLPDFYTTWTDTSSLGCANDIAKAIVKMKQESIEGLILDLRDNGGGSIKEAIDITGMFIDYGPVLVNKDEEKNIYSLKDMNRGIIYRGPLMVMINEYSASASEIVAASLQDYNRAMVVGKKSFGKATGQSIIPLEPISEASNRRNKGGNNDWGFVKITHIGLYRNDLTTNQNRGVIPDIDFSFIESDNTISESAYPNALNLDTISKKIYFTPLPQIEKNDLKTQSINRQKETHFADQIKANNELNNLFSELDNSNLGLDERLALNIKIEKLLTQFEEQQKTLNLPYEINFLKTDNDIYSISPYLNKYRENFRENLSADLEILETYSILRDWIK